MSAQKEKDVKKDNINPSHYKNGGSQVWEQMVTLYGLYAFNCFCNLNAYKYRMRAGYKTDDVDGVTEDINKAKWYETMRDIAHDVNNNEPDIPVHEKIRKIKNHPMYPAK